MWLRPRLPTTRIPPHLSLHRRTTDLRSACVSQGAIGGRRVRPHPSNRPGVLVRLQCRVREVRPLSYVWEPDALHVLVFLVFVAFATFHMDNGSMLSVGLVKILISLHTQRSLRKGQQLNLQVLPFLHNQISQGGFQDNLYQIVLHGNRVLP